jgi:DNA-binding MarR family transcriptional regulator
VSPESGTAAKRAAALWVRLAKCYGLVLRDVRAFESRAAVTLPQFDALAQLLRHPEGATATALSEALLVTRGNVTGIVARLVARGLVRREVLPRDRRAAILRLTPRGRRIAAAHVARHERHLRKVFGSLRASDQAALRRSLDRLRRSLERRIS